jgi:hypothetical protein
VRIKIHRIQDWAQWQSRRPGYISSITKKKKKKNQTVTFVAPSPSLHHPAFPVVLSYPFILAATHPLPCLRDVSTEAEVKDLL